MKKLLGLLSIGMILGGSLSNVTACSGSLNPFNLSTWGDTQKMIIIKHYLKDAIKWLSNKDHSLWYYWLSSSQGEVLALTEGMRIINPSINPEYSGSFDPKHEDKINVIYTIINPPSDPDGKLKLVDVLKNGITYVCKGLTTRGYIGEMDFTIKD